jgi:hypothetical protein
MNILLMDGLPEEYDGIEISADFRNMIQLDLIIRDEEVTELERTIAALNQLYPEIPSDLQKAIKGLQWFYSRGTSEDKESAGEGGSSKRGFCFNQDANLIYAAFFSTYNISLSTIDFLHWWEFMALFEGLPEDTLMKKVIYWRTADLAKVSKEERKQIIKMRKLFELKGNSKKQTMTVEELTQQTMDRVERRFAEAQALLDKQ